MGNVLQQPQGFWRCTPGAAQRCLWCHEGEPAEQEVPQALGSPLRALSPQLGHFPASSPSGRSRAEAAGTRHLCHPAGTHAAQPAPLLAPLGAAPMGALREG